MLVWYDGGGADIDPTEADICKWLADEGLGGQSSSTIAAHHMEDEEVDYHVDVSGAGTMLHVRNIGVHGWDGTEHGVGAFENEEALRQIFSAFGVFSFAVIRHRIQAEDDGSNQVNSSWALVTMGDRASADRVLLEQQADGTVMAGDTALVISLYSPEKAKASLGGMRGKRPYRDNIVLICRFIEEMNNE